MSVKTLEITTQAPFLVTIPETAVAFKKEQLALSGKVVSIASDEDQGAATQVIASLKGIVRDVEAMRKELTQPFLDAQRDIKARADTFTQEISAEINRINSMNSAYQAEKVRVAQEKAEAERRRIREALLAEQEEKRKAEELRVQQERAEAKRIEEELEAERKRLEQERLDALALEAEKPENVAKLKAEQERIRIEREEQERIAREKAEAERARIEEEILRSQIAAAEAEEAANKALQERQSQQDTKVAGASVRQEYEIQIDDIHKLYVEHPQCVDMKARLNSIKDLIRVGKLTVDNSATAGITLIPKVSVNVRAGASGFKAIQ